MNQWIQHFKWDFPGGVQGIVIVLACGLLLTALSYIFTLRKTSGNAKTELTLLRFIFLLFIVFCLCRPTIARQRSVKNTNKKKIAVLVDDSGSMRIKGFWGKTRLQEAISFWQEKVEKGNDNYKFEFFKFAEKLHPCPDFNSVPPESKPEPAETRLYRTIDEACARFAINKVDGVIYLTDGIDTSGASPQEIANKLSASSLKHIFVPINTELPSKSYLALRKIEAPNQAFIGTEVPVLLMTQQSNIPPSSEIKLDISKNGGQMVESRKLRTGSGIQSVRLRLPVRKAGIDLYRAVLTLNGKQVAESIWSINKTVRKDSARVLVYQGALDWGTRFLRYIFADNDKIKLELRYAPGTYDINRSQAVNNFPSSTELSGYDVVVLFNLNRKQISPRMERDLQNFVRNGGGLFFLNGNPVSVREFADSPLETLLPVTFEAKPNQAERSDPGTAVFLRRVNAAGKSGTRWDASFRQSKEFTFKVPELRKFTLSRIGRQSPIFQTKSKLGKTRLIIPQFQDIAWIKEAKPGANILAYWEDKENKNARRILLAYQNFGKGRSMALATDPLWRWRMNTPSENKDFEKFWKNLFFWLAQGQKEEARWQIPNLIIPGKEEMTIYFIPGKDLADLSKVKVYLKHQETTQELLLQPESSSKRYFVKFTPDYGQKYILKAQAGDKVIAETAFMSQPLAESRMEKVILKPDLKILHEFAVLPNVYLENAQEGFDVKKYFTTQTVVLAEKESFPLWHRWWIYLVIVGFFAAEMIIRRFFKLV
jgi:uncharacterized membrane protein